MAKKKSKKKETSKKEESKEVEKLYFWSKYNILAPSLKKAKKLYNERRGIKPKK
jgi:hypothetical protein